VPDLHRSIDSLGQPTHGDEIVRGHESATQPARTVVVVPIPPELIGERRDEFHAVLFRRESVDGPLLVGDLVFRSLYGDEGDVRRIRAVRTEGPLEDEVIPTRERGMVWDERAIDDFLQESSRCRERGERVRDRLRRLRFRDDPEGRLRDDAQRSFRAEEERREVRELAARVRLRSGLEQVTVRPSGSNFTMWFIFRMSIRTPPRFGTEPPYHPVPPPRGVICNKLSSLSFTRAATSSVVCGKATKSGYSFHWRSAIFGRDAKSWL